LKEKSITTKINGYKIFVEWTDPDPCGLLRSVNREAKGTKDANQRDFRTVMLRPGWSMRASHWKH